MTRENLIFLGACTIMSSNPKNFYDRDLVGAEGAVYDQQQRVNHAIKWSQYFYDQVHTTDYNQTAAEPARADVWIIQRHRFDDMAGKWAQSQIADGEFSTELEAERALDTWLLGKEEPSSFFRYRVGKL